MLKGAGNCSEWVEDGAPRFFYAPLHDADWLLRRVLPRLGEGVVRQIAAAKDAGATAEPSHFRIAKERFKSTVIALEPNQQS